MDFNTPLITPEDEVRASRRARGHRPRHAWDRFLMAWWLGAVDRGLYRCFPDTGSILLQFVLVFLGGYWNRALLHSSLLCIGCSLLGSLLCGHAQIPGTWISVLHSVEIKVFVARAVMVLSSADPQPARRLVYETPAILLLVFTIGRLLPRLTHPDGFVPSLSANNSSLPPFTYADRLDDGHVYWMSSSRHRIRLVQLHPWHPFRRVQGSLETVKLSDAPKYTAISYTREEETSSSSSSSSHNTHAVILNGKSFPCSKVTYHALYHTSTLFDSRWVWIDELCVDQLDDGEKGSTEAALGDYIYGLARDIRCQLSPPPCANSHRVGRLIRKLAWFGHDFEPSHAELVGFLEQEIHAYGEQHWCDLVDFFANPWFTSPRTAREVVAGYWTEVYYGDRYVNWYSMAYVAGVLADDELLPLLRRCGNGDRARENALHFLGVLRVRHAHFESLQTGVPQRRSL